MSARVSRSCPPRLRRSSKMKESLIMSNIASVKAEVQVLLTEDLKLNAVKLTPAGGFSFRVDSAEVFIDVIARGEGANADTIVSMYSPVGIEVPMTPALFEY